MIQWFGQAGHSWRQAQENKFGVGPPWLQHSSRRLKEAPYGHPILFAPICTVLSATTATTICLVVM